MTQLVRTARVLLVVGIWACISLIGGPSHSSAVIDFTDCTSTPTSPLPTVPGGELTPPPTEAPPGPTAPPVTTPTPAPQNCMPTEGDQIHGSRTVRFTVAATGGQRIDAIRMFILADEEGLPDANKGDAVFSETYEGSARVPAKTVTYTWDSNEETPRNGIYKIKVEAETSGVLSNPDEATAERNNLRVNNFPNAVGAPEIIASTSSSVNVQWPSATEPDVLSYSLYRAVTSSTKEAPGYDELEPLAVTTEPTFRDTKVPAAVYWYAVSVTRRSVVTPESGISSQLSPISGAAEVKAVTGKPGGGTSDPGVEDGDGGPIRIPPFRQLSTDRGGKLPPVPDAPYSAYLPYNDAPAGLSAGEGGEPGGDPRGAVLPVAVGAFLVSSALALGRMPY